ncbi:hypothetical protein CALCODRAFT_500447 [Calocera cornea HHB12733]|uniref:Uncharacterized protein n=1 Tax=Calocera cornea HHB12733 TaxID=1353952 RepID=A0A165E322_9BASI|nr:hypothetical protein CALCODRAFT_500447 [Calocera cornea HHB12733]
MAVEGEYSKDSRFAFANVVVQEPTDGNMERYQGTIIVRLWPGNYRAWKAKSPLDFNTVPIVLGPENATVQARTAQDLLLVSEREKLVRDHCVSFKTVQERSVFATSNPMDESPVSNSGTTELTEPEIHKYGHDDNDEDAAEGRLDKAQFTVNSLGLDYTFIFHYNSFGQLQASGVIPSSEELYDMNAELKKEVGNLKEELKMASKEQKKSRADLHVLKEKVKKLQGELATGKAGREGLQAEVARMTAELDRGKAAQEGLRAEVARLRAERVVVKSEPDGNEKPTKKQKRS